MKIVVHSDDRWSLYPPYGGVPRVFRVGGSAWNPRTWIEMFRMERVLLLWNVTRIPVYWEDGQYLRELEL